MIPKLPSFRLAFATSACSSQRALALVTEFVRLSLQFPAIFLREREGLHKSAVGNVFPVFVSPLLAAAFYSFCYSCGRLGMKIQLWCHDCRSKSTFLMCWDFRTKICSIRISSCASPQSSSKSTRLGVFKRGRSNSLHASCLFEDQQSFVSSLSTWSPSLLYIVSILASDTTNKRRDQWHQINQPTVDGMLQ